MAVVLLVDRKAQMISHAHRCIFVHIPKTAGTNIETAFGLGHRGLGVQDHRSLRAIAGPPRRPLAYCSFENTGEAARSIKYQIRRPPNPKSVRRLPAAQYEEYFKFTVVRNPWARAHSWYRNVLQDEVHQTALGVNTDIRLSDFLRRFIGKGALRPQLVWLRDYRGRVAMDYICRFENLAADFTQVCKRIGAESIVLPGHRDPSTSYLDAYDVQTREMIANAYDEEIAFFGYTFENGV